MKVQKQVTGIKHWYGQDLLDLQGEPLAAIEGVLKRLGSCILQGCEITGTVGNYNIAAGLVLLVDGTVGPKICRFPGVNGVALPCYLKLTATDTNRAYSTGGSKVVYTDYAAAYSATVPTETYITINATGNETWIDKLGKYDAANVTTTPTANKVLTLDANKKVSAYTVSNGTKQTYANNDPAGSFSTAVAYGVGHLDISYINATVDQSVLRDFELDPSCELFYAKIIVQHNGSTGSSTVRIVQNSSVIYSQQVSGNGGTTYYMLFQKIGGVWFKIVAPTMTDFRV